MSQQINLLNLALIERSELLNTNRIIALLGVCFISLFGYYFYESNALSALKQQRTNTARQLEQIKQSFKEAAVANKPKVNTALLAKITQLEHKEMEQKAIINATKKTNPHHTKSYAALLRAFSKQSIEGLWITGLTIDQDAQNLSISGRTLNADLVPKYISRLRSEPALKGKTFTDLSMQGFEKKSVSSTHKNSAAKLQNALSATKKSNNVVVTVKASEKMAYKMPDYIEFTLKSVAEEKADLQQKTAGVSN